MFCGWGIVSDDKVIPAYSNMPTPPWATDDQLEFLNAQKPVFHSAQRTGTTANFFCDITIEFFRRWPDHSHEKRITVLTKKDTKKASKRKDPHDLSHLTLAEWTEKRKAQLHNWFNNNNLKSAEDKSAMTKAVGIDAADVPLPPPRALTRPQILSKDAYDDLIQPLVKKRLEEEPNRAHIDVVQQCSIEAYAMLDDEKKKVIQEKYDQQRAERIQMLEEAKNPSLRKKPTVDQMTNAITGLPGRLERYFESLARETGWCFSVICGGPDLGNGGKLRTFSVHEGEDCHGLNFGDIRKKYMHNDLVVPFLSFLNKIYRSDSSTFPSTDNSVGPSDGVDPLPELVGPTNVAIQDTFQNAGPNVNPSAAPENLAPPSQRITKADEQTTQSSDPLPESGNPLAAAATDTNAVQPPMMNWFIDQNTPAGGSQPNALDVLANWTVEQWDEFAKIAAGTANGDHSIDQNQHIYDQNPVYYQNQVVYDQNQPVYDQNQPIYNQHQVTYNQGQMNYDQHQGANQGANAGAIQNGAQPHVPTSSQNQDGNIDTVRTRHSEQNVPQGLVPLVIPNVSPISPIPLLDMSAIVPNVTLPVVPAIGLEERPADPNNISAPIREQSLGPMISKSTVNAPATTTDSDDRPVRNRRRAGGKEIPVSSQWLETASKYLSSDLDIVEWNSCVEAWDAFERREINEQEISSQRLASKERPAVLTKWLASRKYDSIPQLDDVKKFADDWMRWWNSAQPDWRKNADVLMLPHGLSTGKGKQQMQAFKKSVRKSGPTGLLPVMVGLKWWAEIRDQDPRWKLAVEDITACLVTFSSTDLKRASSEGDESRRKKKVKA